MRDVGERPPGTMKIVDDLHGDYVAAHVYEPDANGHPLLRLNRALLFGDDFDRVLSWARRELALGKRVSWLLADELTDPAS